MDGDGEDRPEELIDFFNQVQEIQLECDYCYQSKKKQKVFYLNFYTQCIKFSLILLLVNSLNLVIIHVYQKAQFQTLSDGSVWLSYSGAVTKHFPQFSIIQSSEARGILGLQK